MEKVLLKLTEIAKKYDIVILAGLFEKDENDNLFKAYVCVDKNGLGCKVSENYILL